MNKMGGSRSSPLMELTKISSWCLAHSLEIKAQHLPGKVNVTADYLRDRKDWILDPGLFALLNKRWGPL